MTTYQVIVGVVLLVATVSAFVGWLCCACAGMTADGEERPR
jgi:hypothetical protein